MITIDLAGVFRAPPDVDRRGDRGAGRNADRNALDPRHQAGGVEGGLVADGDDLVDHGAIEDRRNEAGADALDLVRPGRAAGEDGRVFRLDRDHADARLARFQHLADAGDRAAGADAGDDDIDLAARCRSRFPPPWCGDGSPDWRDSRIAAA